MLGAIGYKTKKELKTNIGNYLRYEETSFFGTEFKENGVNVIVGPNAYTARNWFAEVTCENGIIKSVK